MVWGATRSASFPSWRRDRKGEPRRFKRCPRPCARRYHPNARSDRTGGRRAQGRACFSATAAPCGRLGPMKAAVARGEPPEYDNGMSPRAARTSPRKGRITVTLDPEVIRAGNIAVAAGRAVSLSAWINSALSQQVDKEKRLQAMAEAIKEYE